MTPDSSIYRSKSLPQEVEALTSDLAGHDAYTLGHCSRVEVLSLELGRRIGLDPSQLELLRFASRLHDIGKLVIPQHILRKPGLLDAEEWAVMQSHAAMGHMLCVRLPLPHGPDIGWIVRHHHEAMDGSGYPDGLHGEAIPVCSRIISLSDAYDAMLTTRPYHPARSQQEVLAIMAEESGGKFDAYLFSHFRRIAEHGDTLACA